MSRTGKPARLKGEERDVIRDDALREIAEVVREATAHMGELGPSGSFYIGQISGTLLRYGVPLGALVAAKEEEGSES